MPSADSADSLIPSWVYFFSHLVERAIDPLLGLIFTEQAEKPLPRRQGNARQLLTIQVVDILRHQTHAREAPEVAPAVAC